VLGCIWVVALPSSGGVVKKNQKWVVVISLDYDGPVRAFGRGLSLGRYHRKLSEQHLQTTIQPIPVLLEMAEASFLLILHAKFNPKAKASKIGREPEGRKMPDEIIDATSERRCSSEWPRRHPIPENRVLLVATKSSL